MVKMEFWKSWKRITKLEETAVLSVKAGKKLIFKHIPKEKIISIYLKGSFIQREMNKNSDVDFFVIVSESRYVEKLVQLNKKYKNSRTPALNIDGYSLWELKLGKNVKPKSKKLMGRPNPKRIVSHLPHYKLIYGDSLDLNKLASNSPENRLNSLINVFNSIFLPFYEQKKFRFSEIIKQTFWLFYNEEDALGHQPAYEWKKLAKSIKKKNHIVHDALRLRKHPSKDKTVRNTYMKKLKRYLGRLHDTYGEH